MRRNPRAGRQPGGGHHVTNLYNELRLIYQKQRDNFKEWMQKEHPDEDEATIERDINDYYDFVQKIVKLDK